MDLTMLRMMLPWLSAVTLAATLMACNKPPVKGVTYHCRSPQNSHDLFVRLGDDGSMYMGTDATTLEAVLWTSRYDDAGVATWIEQEDSRTVTTVLNRDTGAMDLTYAPGQGGTKEHIPYACKPL